MTGSAPTRNQRLTDSVLWGIIIAYAVGSRIIPGFITPLLFPFALVHGGRRYGWKTIAVFMIVTAIVSNILENTSILTGFPFGHYHYTDALGPKSSWYAVMGLTPVLTFVIGGRNSQVTDAAGVVWQTRSIAESVAIVSLYTMLFAVALSAVRLIQAPATAPETAAQGATPVTREALTAAR